MPSPYPKLSLGNTKMLYFWCSGMMVKIFMDDVSKNWIFRTSIASRLASLLLFHFFLPLELHSIEGTNREPGTSIENTKYSGKKYSKYILEKSDKSDKLKRINTSVSPSLTLKEDRQKIRQLVRMKNSNSKSPTPDVFDFSPGTEINLRIVV